MSKLGKKLIAAVSDIRMRNDGDSSCKITKRYVPEGHTPVTAAMINSTEFPRAKRIAEIMDVLDGPDQECYPMCHKGMTKDTCPYNPNLGCDCRANPPNGNFYVTDPHHGGKITCHKCNGFILEKDYLLYTQYNESAIAHFHKDCYNSYEHYYGLDKPID